MKKHSRQSNKGGKRNILITGVTRVIGRQLAEDLYNDKRVNRILGIASEDKPYYFQDFDFNRFIYRSMNILRSRDLNNLFTCSTFRDANIDTIVHLAFVGDPRTYKEDAHGLNVSGTKTILDRVLAIESIRKFVFLSSGLVYKLRGNTDVFITEDHELNFDTEAHPLVKDAVDAEMLCRAKMDHRRCKVIVIRPSGIVGRNIRSELNTLFESTICAVPFGFDPMVNPIHTKDVVNALKLAIFTPVSGVFNVAGKTIAPIKEFLKLSGVSMITVPHGMVKSVNSTLRTLRLTEFNSSINPERLRHSLVLDISKARSVLGYEPKHHIKFR